MVLIWIFVEDGLEGMIWRLVVGYGVIYFFNLILVVVSCDDGE